MAQRPGRAAPATSRRSPGCGKIASNFAASEPSNPSSPPIHGNDI